MEVVEKRQEAQTWIPAVAVTHFRGKIVGKFPACILPPMAEKHPGWQALGAFFTQDKDMHKALRGAYDFCESRWLTAGHTESALWYLSVESHARNPAVQHRCWGPSALAPSPADTSEMLLRFLRYGS